MNVALLIIVPMLFFDSIFEGTIFESKPEKPPETPDELCAMMYGKVMSLHQAARRAREKGQDRAALNSYYKAIMVLKNIEATQPDWNSATVKTKIEDYRRRVEQLEMSVEESERIYKQALTKLQGNLQKDPLNPAPRVELADFYFHYGRYKDAERQLRKATNLKDMSADTRIKLGNAYEAQGRYDYAITEYRRALRLDQGSALAHYNLAIAHFTMKAPQMDIAGKRTIRTYPKATEELKRAIEIDPLFVEAYIYLGMIYNRQKQYKFALAALKKAYQINPDNPVVNYNLGSTYCSILNFVNATSYMNKAADLVGRDTEMGRSIRQQITELRRYNLKGQEGRGYRDRKRMLIYKGRTVSGPKFRRWKRRRDRWATEYKQRYL